MNRGWANAEVLVHVGFGRGSNVGWRETYLILGVLAVIAGAGMALLIENDPRDRGLGPDGDPPQVACTSLRVPGASIKEALRSQQFIGL